MRRTITRLAAVAGALSLLGVAACGSDSTGTDQKAGASGSQSVLKVATDATFPPFEYLGADNRSMQGFDIDLGNALGEKLGTRVQFAQLSFDGLIPALRGGRFDLIMAGMADLPERQKQVDFVNYFRSGLGILVKKGNPEGIASLEDLCGKTVAVQKGTAQVDLVTKQNGQCDRKIQIRTFPAETDAQLQVRTGRATADVTDYPVAIYTAKTAGGGDQYEVANTPQYDTTLYGVAVAKGNAELRDRVKGGLEQLIGDGTYKRLLDKWGLGNLAIDKVTINGSASS
jgi:polar amino acid transport system substrate-binding protein